MVKFFEGCADFFRDLFIINFDCFLQIPKNTKSQIQSKPQIKKLADCPDHGKGSFWLCLNQVSGFQFKLNRPFECDKECLSDDSTLHLSIGSQIAIEPVFVDAVHACHGSA